MSSFVITVVRNVVGPYLTYLNGNSTVTKLSPTSKLDDTTQIPFVVLRIQKNLKSPFMKTHIQWMILQRFSIFQIQPVMSFTISTEPMFLDVIE